MAHGCTYCTDDFHCEKFTSEKCVSWCYGKDYPCKDRRISNADRIKAMTDEELAKWFVNLEVKILNIQPMLDRPALEKDWLEWLREEMTE